MLLTEKEKLGIRRELKRVAVQMEKISIHIGSLLFFCDGSVQMITLIDMRVEIFAKIIRDIIINHP
jgi:hypothetical protein